ncbi:MAG: hypothetical protein IIC53_15820 [Proteobacteria bacterium]|nr:hypothetical protein [Pseudomonadota bacterium]
MSVTRVAKAAGVAVLLGAGILMGLYAAPARADFEAGWRAYQRGDFSGALESWRPLADAGDARAQFIRIIRPRLEEIFEIARARLEASGFADKAGRRMVLTGGASQLHGLRELAAQMFGKSVRLGRPRSLQGLAEATGGPAYSTCAGLLHYARRRRAAPADATVHGQAPAAGRLGRIGEWLHAHF